MAEASELTDDVLRALVYRPDLDDYQQLSEPKTGRFDCSAYTGAILADAHTKGREKLSGRKIRLATNEPIPNKTSPGLRLDQVADAVRKLTDGKVRLDVVFGIPFNELRRRATLGEWVGIQVARGVFIDAGEGTENRFRLGHAMTLHAEAGVPIIGDPLIDHYWRSDWATVRKACGMLLVDPREGSTVGLGRAYAMFTRDTDATFNAVVRPSRKPKRRFRVYRLDSDGRIAGFRRTTTTGFSAPSTAPAMVPWPNRGPRPLVMITSGGRKGQYVHARFAQQKGAA